MTKQEFQPDHKEQNFQPVQSEPESQIKKEPTLAQEIKETYRKVEKVRDVLHTAGNVEVGGTPNEVLIENRAYRLLHYRQMVSKTRERRYLLFMHSLIGHMCLTSSMIKAGSAAC